MPATFSKPLTDQNVKVKGTSVMECELTRPNAKVCWQKDGQNIIPDHKFEISSNNCSRMLKVNDIATDDGGTYKCVCGSENTECRITVEGKFRS